jgi:hypothetical protein
MRFIVWFLGSEVNEIAAVDQFADEGIDWPQGELWGTFEIATNEAVLRSRRTEYNRQTVHHRR